ncbi:17756_t:CDS:2, partial [Acaulospora morrowiae]
KTYRLWKKQIYSAKIIQNAIIEWLYRPGSTFMKQAEDRYHQQNNAPKDLNIFDLPELLEQILYFLENDRSLYPALFVNRFWYHCSAPILWRDIDFFINCQGNTYNNYSSGDLYWRLLKFKRVMCGKIKPLYCSKMKLRHLELGDCSIGNNAVEEIARNCTNLKYLSLKGCRRIGEE